jgi:hypothetical protein
MDPYKERCIDMSLSSPDRDGEEAKARLRPASPIVTIDA